MTCAIITIVIEVDLKLFERGRAKYESERLLEVERDQVPASHHGINPPPNQAVKPPEQCHQSAYSGGRALVEALPIVVFGETGKQQVMELRDSGCNTTLIDESLAKTLGLQGKEVDLEIQEVNAQKVFSFQHTKKCNAARDMMEFVKYPMRNLKKFGPDQKLK